MKLNLKKKIYLMEQIDESKALVEEFKIENVLLNEKIKTLDVKLTF